VLGQDHDHVAVARPDEASGVRVHSPWPGAQPCFTAHGRPNAAGTPKYRCGGSIVVEVADHEPGLADAVLPRVFDR
jgi:hypothetical protein